MSLCEYGKCNICLESNHTTVSIHNSNESNIEWVSKLQFTIPEVEWLEEYVICDSCIKQVETAWQFKKRVLNLEPERRSILTRKDLYQEETNDFRDNYETPGYFFREEEQYACNICFKSFTTQTQLRQHTLQHHIDDDTPKDSEVKVITSCKVEELFTCYDCDVGFNTKQELLCHVTNDHGKVEVCLVCKKLCSNRVGLTNHMKYDHCIETQKQYVCSNCSKNFESMIELNEHIQVYRNQSLCCACEKFYTSQKDLQDHLKLCRDPLKKGNLYQCSTCKNSYVSEKNLDLHKVWCSKEDSKIIKENTLNYNCDICTIEFDNLQEYNHHNLSHDLHNETADTQPTCKKRKGRNSHRSFSCEICNKQFGYIKLVVQHCILEHGMEKKRVKPYSCEKCEMRFASSANLDQHRHYHDKNRKHVCTLCGKGFITKSDLTVHEYTHYNRRNYKCSKCDKAFNTNKNLRTHNLVVHTDRSLWKYGCSVCEKRFPLKTNYEQHMRRHTGEKKYVCHICTKAFISKTEMKRHINLHSNIKAFKCSICGKEYKERRTYETHSTKVHGLGNAKIPVREKKFVCHICPSQFYDKQKLSKHLCSHSGLKPFPCYACDKKFTDKSYLKHHLKTVHNIIEPPKVDLME